MLDQLLVARIVVNSTIIKFIFNYSMNIAGKSNYLQIGYMKYRISQILLALRLFGHFDTKLQIAVTMLMKICIIYFYRTTVCTPLTWENKQIT